LVEDYLKENKIIQLKWKILQSKIPKDSHNFSPDDLRNVWHSKQIQLAQEARAEVHDEVVILETKFSTKNNDNYLRTTFSNFLSQCMQKCTVTAY